MQAMEAISNVVSDLMCIMVDSVCYDEFEGVDEGEEINGNYDENGRRKRPTSDQNEAEPDMLDDYDTSSLNLNETDLNVLSSFSNELRAKAKLALSKPNNFNIVANEAKKSSAAESNNSTQKSVADCTASSETAATTLSAQKQQALSVKDPELAGIEDPYELDAFMMFRAFCKLSLRSIEGGGSGAASSASSSFALNSSSPEFRNNIDVKSKVLSLQLILATLQNAKPSFKQSTHMIGIIRRYLCVSLSKNGVSPILEVCAR